MFKAILIGQTTTAHDPQLVELDEAQLPEGDVRVQVEYSSINYKDGLAITGRAPVVRHYPLVPGIDLAGSVEHSTHPDWKPGDKVVLNGWGIGEIHWGGLAQQARVNGDWLVPLPDGFSTRQAMAIGTAGYTAMLSVLALEKHGIKPSDGPLLVTGATLYGIDSVMAPSALRLQAWSRLQQDLDQHKLAAMTAEISLNEVIKTAPDILAGKLRGRMVVDVDR